MKMSGASIVCETLLRQGVEVIFGHPGGAILPFYDALYHYPQLRHILVRHEQAASHAAEGYARVTGRVGVCVATSGPGATNLMTGLTAAKMDSTPVVAITGQVARNFMGKEAFQECDTTGMAKPLVKKTYLVMDPKDIAATLCEAFETAKSGRPGPVLVDLPKDVQAEEVEFNYPENYPSPTKPTLPKKNDLAQAARLLNQAKRPLLLVGHGIHLSGGWNELKDFAEQGNIPVINTIHGTGAFPRHHDLSMGMLGMHGMYWNNILVDECDLVVGVGMRFDDRVIGRPGSFAPLAKIIHLEIDPSQIEKNVPTDLPLIGNLKDTLAALLPSLQKQPREKWFNRIQELKQAHPSLQIPQSDALLPQYVLSSLNKLLQEVHDPIVVTGVGQHQMWAAQYMSLNSPRSFVSSGGLGVMGFEVPAAIGAQVGRPEATVWSIAGDGGFQMTLQELATVSQEHLPIKYAIINNGYLGMVRQWQELFYDHRYKAVPMSGPNFVKLAQAYGIPALDVQRQEEVEPALRAATAYNGPHLINFLVAQEENVYPMVPPGASLAETVEDPRFLHTRQQLTAAPEGTVSYP